MTNANPMLTAKLAPNWLAHRYDEQADAIHLVEADRALRRSVPFLIDQHLPNAKTPVVAKRTEILARMSDEAPLHFIFHSAFCCSTLLAAAFDTNGVATAYKEPQILNDMVGWRHRRGDPMAVQQVLDQSLSLLARPFQPGEAVVIKPSNIVNGLAEAMMTMRPNTHAILMYTPLPNFLNSIARKGMDGRLWARELLTRQLTDGLINLGFEQRDYLLHTDLQAAAVGWLAQWALFDRMAKRWPNRIRTLDAETLVSQPEATMRAATTHFKMPVDDAKIAAIVATVFSKNSKDGSVFKSEQRTENRATGDTLHADEIKKVAIWGNAVRANAGLPEHMMVPLITG